MKAAAALALLFACAGACLGASSPDVVLTELRAAKPRFHHPDLLSSALHELAFGALDELGGLNNREWEEVDAGLKTAEIPIGDRARLRRMVRREPSDPPAPATPSAGQRRLQETAIIGGSCADATGLQSALESVTARVAGLEVYTHISAAPKNLIAQWAGGAETVPAGWVLCDGQNGTPDLRDKFVLGAGGQYAAGSAGGSATAALGATGGVWG